MRKYLKFLIIFSIAIFSSGCETNLFGPKYSKKNLHHSEERNSLNLSTGNEYKKQLSLNFASHSDSLGVKYDFCDSKIMNMKAKNLLIGKEVLPQNPYHLWLPDESRTEIVGAWQFLNYVLKNGGSSQKNLANLHFYYECWIHQTKEKENGFFSTVCKNQFLRLMNVVINGCKTNFLVEFFPSAQQGSGLSGLALDSSAQNVIYSFLKNYNDSITNNKFLIVGEREHAIKVANFMNIQGGIEKNRLKIIISEKMDEGVIGLFMDNPDTRYCFTNSHKKSFNQQSYLANQTKIHDYSAHNEIKQEESENNIHQNLFTNEITLETNKKEDLEFFNKNEEKKSIEAQVKTTKEDIFKKNDRILERIK